MRTTTLVCRRGHHRDSAELASSVSVIDGLCEHPELIVEHATGADRLVLALHRDDYALAEVQTQARLLGLDPFGVQILHLSSGVGPALAVELTALAARAEAYGGSEPEHAKASFPKRLSRRALLTVPKPEYEAVPFVDQETCAADAGCQACVDVCPQEAYRWMEGSIHYDKSACESCGQCVTTCPAGAISNPTVTPAQLRAQIETVVTASVTPVGIAFTCRQGRRPTLGKDWYAVEVPCTGMVPGSWIVAALLLGAGSSTAVPCGDSGCPLDHDQEAREAVWFARTLLAQAGENPDHAPKAAVPVPFAPIEPQALEDPFGLHGPAEVVLTLMSSVGRKSTVAFDHPAAPLGTIDIDRQTCTACLTCTTTCPTGALSHNFSEDHVSLVFDAGRCTACGQCISRCPELARGAITLTRAVNTRLLGLGPQVVVSSRLSQCEACGQPVAPDATLERIGALLGSEYTATMAILSTRCQDCRGKG